MGSDRIGIEPRLKATQLIGVGRSGDSCQAGKGRIARLVRIPRDGDRRSEVLSIAITS